MSKTLVVGSKTVTPRNFLLLESLNKAGNYTHVTFGLIDEALDEKKYKNNYIKMEHWNGTMMYDDGENMNIFELTIHCTKNYPKERPIIIFAQQSLEHKRLKKVCNSDGHLIEPVIQLIKSDETTLLGDYLTSVLNIIATYR